MLQAIIVFELTDVSIAGSEKTLNKLSMTSAEKSAVLFSVPSFPDSVLVPWRGSWLALTTTEHLPCAH